MSLSHEKRNDKKHELTFYSKKKNIISILSLTIVRDKIDIIIKSIIEPEINCKKFTEEIHSESKACDDSQSDNIKNP